MTFIFHMKYFLYRSLSAIGLGTMFFDMEDVNNEEYLDTSLEKEGGQMSEKAPTFKDIAYHFNELIASAHYEMSLRNLANLSKVSKVI